MTMTTNWLVALLLTAMAASVTGSHRFGEWAGFDQVPPVFPVLRPRSVSRAAQHQASLPSRLRQADHHLTIVDAPCDHWSAVGSLGWNWLCMLVVVALTLGVPIPLVRRHNRRPRVSATGTAPAKLAWLVLSTLATTVSGDPDYGCWQMSAVSESCDTRCASLGGCSAEDTFLHRDEIDSHAEVKVLIEGLTGQTCGSRTFMYDWNPTPYFDQRASKTCAGRKDFTSASDFDCTTSSPDRKRLCWCSSCASPPPFQPGLVPPSPPPPSYVKLATDGECQGWYIQKAGYSAKECQDMCDLSPNCGATTFMQSSADNCESRLPPQPLATCTPPPTSAVHASVPTALQSQQPMRPKPRRAAPLQAGCTSRPNRAVFRPNQSMGNRSETAATTTTGTAARTCPPTSRRPVTQVGADTATCASLRRPLLQPLRRRRPVPHPRRCRRNRSCRRYLPQPLRCRPRRTRTKSCSRARAKRRAASPFLRAWPLAPLPARRSPSSQRPEFIPVRTFHLAALSTRKVPESPSTQLSQSGPVEGLPRRNGTAYVVSTCSHHNRRPRRPCCPCRRSRRRCRRYSQGQNMFAHRQSSSRLSRTAQSTGSW